MKNGTLQLLSLCLIDSTFLTPHGLPLFPGAFTATTHRDAEAETRTEGLARAPLAFPWWTLSRFSVLTVHKAEHEAKARLTYANLDEFLYQRKKGRGTLWPLWQPETSLPSLYARNTLSETLTSCGNITVALESITQLNTHTYILWNLPTVLAKFYKWSLGVY